MLKTNNITDPALVPDEEKSNNVTKWPSLNLGNVFAYILDKKMCEKEYIGRYKDQKAYSYWDSNFVGEIKTHESLNRTIFLYCNVTASQTMSDVKNLWIAVKKNDKGNEILTAWRSCMAGAYECCNHVIACLYKFDYFHL